jgi:hypothetical protein
MMNYIKMTSIRISNDISLKHLDKKASHYLNRNIMLFGASESGKSTVLFEILYLLKKAIPLIFVFSPTAGENCAFDGIVPSSVIRSEICIPTISAIYARQQAATRIYKMVSDINALRSLFMRVANGTLKNIEHTTNNNAAMLTRKKAQNLSLNEDEKTHAIASINKTRDDFLIKLYKHTVRINKKRLRKAQLTSKELYIIKYLDFNPRCIIVCDDCGSVIKKFQKEEVFKKIMYQGRHNNMQIIFTLQDDTDMAPFMKKQSKVNIFTTDQCAAAYFERPSNNFTKKVRVKADLIISNIFAETVNKKNYKKLMYIRGEPDPFKYTIANVYGKFKFGSPSLWELCGCTSEKNDDIARFEDDPMLSSFKIEL